MLHQRRFQFKFFFFFLFLPICVYDMIMLTNGWKCGNAFSTKFVFVSLGAQLSMSWDRARILLLLLVLSRRLTARHDSSSITHIRSLVHTSYTQQAHSLRMNYKVILSDIACSHARVSILMKIIRIFDLNNIHLMHW